MKIAVLGGGLTGMTASYFLAGKGHHVTLMEKNSELGGLAIGFKNPDWNWHLERAYHHLFANDHDILSFANEIGFDKIFFQNPTTASLYETANNKFQILPLDTPGDLLAFPYLNIADKMRAGAVMAFLKLSPFLPLFEKNTAEAFLKKTMGRRAWISLWEELFRKKFGEYAGIILASFIWARIKKRTKNLGYIEGGFQTFIDYLTNKLTGLRVNVLTGIEIKDIKKRGSKYLINNWEYDAVISTLPTPVMTKITSKIFTAEFLQKYRKLKYLHAMTLILETKEPLLENTYWLNVSTPKIPVMGIVQHTNFIDKNNYGGNHLCYLGWYLKREDKLMNMEKDRLIKYLIPYLKILNSKFSILNSYLFRAPFAQPIFDRDFVENRPGFVTPQKNFFIANLDMTYPYDRGTNYAVKLGKNVSELIKI